MAKKLSEGEKFERLLARLYDAMVEAKRQGRAAVGEELRYKRSCLKHGLRVYGVQGGKKVFAKMTIKDVAAFRSHISRIVGSVKIKGRLRNALGHERSPRKDRGMMLRRGRPR